MSDLGYDGLPTYAVAEVRDGEDVGYVAIGFVSVQNDQPPLNTGTKERNNSVERVSEYRNGNLIGKVIYVMSGFRGHAVNRLHRIAGSRKLTSMSEETLVNLPRLQ